ncbi:acetyl-CoA carboxylase biotin carboxylase subunit family protein [Sinorhizobium meliloti]|uniref:ATP-grasp domain-containing protein n=1 Tax=Rhizobium meliloti TaxID=382 RepID=UPI0002E42C8B|nr:acetyl-CoA carboxylase biotin carboxylase subunit family protein [Sinorhizobium meliloti]MDE3878729.1 acetyl-CoA carboxylase biotin carboxylase subunit family protein [Sinorhizobium meliloti]
MTRRVLVLIEGNRTGSSQLYAQAGQRLGLHPITLCADPGQYDYLAGGKFEAIRVDTDDLAALIRECSLLQSTYDIAGITGAREMFYATVGNLCRHFDLPGPDAAAIERCCDKSTQRQLLGDAGVPIPAYRVAKNATEIEDSAAQIGYPVIVKPSIGSGSTGVRLCRNADELAEHTNYLLGGGHVWRSSPRILVEEFVQGPFYSTNIFGKEVIGVAAADFGRPPHFIFREFTFPAQLGDEEHERIADVSLRCLRALGLGWGPTNIEIRWTKVGPVVIEVNPRLAGTPDPQLIGLAYGVDPIVEHIKLAIGDEVDLKRKQSYTAAARFLVPERDGTLNRISGDIQAAALPGVAEVKFYTESNNAIVPKGDDRDWIGHVIAASPSHSQTKAILQRAVESMSWSIAPFPAADG